MTRHSLLQRALGIAVLVTLIAGITPLLPSALEEATAQVMDETVPVPGEEIVSLRKERSKIFETSDGSRVGRFFTGPVHYQATDGAWQDIDTTLVPSDRSGYAWRNAAAAFTVHFAATASSDDMVLVTDATSSVGFGLEGANAASVGVVDGSTITYPEIKPGIDLVYEVRNGEVKEFIVLKNAPSEPTVFDFPLSLDNLSAADTGESIDLVTAGVRRFFISDLWMIDSAIDPSSGESAFSEDVSGTLVEIAGVPTLRVTPDHSWLTAPERVYPVTVDPTITKQTNDDTYVQSNICCTDVSGESEMKSGTYDGGGTKARSLMKFARRPEPDPERCHY